MAIENSTNQIETPGVQHDSETPVPKKPSLLFIISVSLGVLTLILVSASAYYGVAH
jgi:hypothetical protein